MNGVTLNLSPNHFFFPKIIVYFARKYTKTNIYYVQRKKLLKWGAGIVLTPVLLFVILTVMLYLPPVQNWLVRQVTDYASRQTGMDISVERVRLVFPLDLGVDGFRMIQPNDSLPGVKDTIADVRRLVVDVRLAPLLDKRVEIDALELSGVRLNTDGLIHEARVKGAVGRLYLKSHGVDLGGETVRVDEALLADADVDVALSDTVPPDTSSTKTNWKIIVDRLGIDRTGVTVHMPGDTLQIAAYLGDTEALGGYFDLYSGLYKVRRIDWREGHLAYDNNFEERVKGLDVNHISLTDVALGVDSVYYCASDLRLSLSECSFKEKSGIAVSKMAGRVDMDSVRLSLPAFTLSTPDSYLSARFMMDLDAFSREAPGRISLSADCTLGKQDVMRLLGDMPTAFVRRWPNQPLTVKAVVAGNMDNLRFGGVNAKLPTAFNINMSGTAAGLNDADRLEATASIDAKAYDLGFVTELLKAGGGAVSIPRNIGLKGRVGIDGKRYRADLTATEGGGSLKAEGWFDAGRMSYEASVAVEQLKVGHFIPTGGLGDLTAHASVKGRGVRLMSRATALTADAVVDKFSIGEYNLDSISLAADMKGGRARIGLGSDNPLAKGTVALNAAVNPKMIRSTLEADLKHVDWYGLRLVESQMTTSLRCRVDVGTDLKNVLRVKGTVNDLVITDSARVFRPDDLLVDVITSRDTTHFVTECGDFRLHFNGRGGYRKILDKGRLFAEELSAQLEAKQIDISELRKKLPLAHLYLTTGKDNPLSRFIAAKGFVFQDADVDFATSPVTGFNGDIRLLELQNASVKLDTIRLNVVSDSSSCTYSAQVRNNAENKQYVFNALLDGYVFEKGSGANVRVYDARDSLGIKLGFEASMEADGIKVRMLADDPVLGYKTFKVNDDNYLYMGADRRVSAKLRLTAADGTGIHLYSNDDNAEALQDMTLGLNKFDLKKVLSVVPFMPDIGGTLNGDFHVIQMPDEFSLSASVSVDGMTYGRSRMGDIGTEFVYMPMSDGTHTLNGVLSCNGEQVAELSGSYNSESQAGLDAELRLERFPVRLLNGFIPDRVIRLSGYADGGMTVGGQVGSPRIDGKLEFDSCYVRSALYGVSMRLSDEPLRVVGSNLLFEDFKMYANNDNALTLDGNIDFSDPTAMTMDLDMTARNYQIIDAKENRRSVAFGKAFVDFFGKMSGNADRMRMQGRVDVLGSTDMSYVLRDTPLSTDNRMDELVKFVSFDDTTATVVEHQPISGFAMDLTVNVAQGAHVMCYLNADHSNYVDITGGGSLRLQYGLTGDMRLTGRYTLDTGVMKYSLPVIPLKTFNIRDGSYIEFTGDPMNPRLNITATERTKANVSTGDGGQGRTVEFDCGVVITKTLADMGLEFTLSAPEDMTLNSELQSMSVEQRGKLAVTMLTTGMYLADGNTGKFSMNNALNSFLQSEINNITGSALRSLDLSFGMDNSTDASGGTHTDYSFKFSKRFWNNRMKIVVGGKVSTGPEVANQNESFFDNVTLEYRLGESSDKYVRLYYDNNAYDWLEGTVREYGAGFVWRRSLQSFKDIFRFGRKRNETPLPADSTKTNSK